MKKGILAFLILASTVFANETKKEEVKCYKELTNFLYTLSTLDRNLADTYKAIIPVMKEDGFSCREIYDFVTYKDRKKNK